MSVKQITLGESPVSNLPSYPTSQSFPCADQLRYPGSLLCVAAKNLIQFSSSLGIKHQERAVRLSDTVAMWKKWRQSCAIFSTKPMSEEKQCGWVSSDAVMGWEVRFKIHSLFWGTLFSFMTMEKAKMYKL